MAITLTVHSFTYIFCFLSIYIIYNMYYIHINIFFTNDSMLINFVLTKNQTITLESNYIHNKFFGHDLYSTSKF